MPAQQCAGRIGSRIAHLDPRIDSNPTKYDTAEAHLNDCLALDGDCRAIDTGVDN